MRCDGDLMTWLREFLARRRAKKREKEGARNEELRVAFTARYHEFKLLLNANNRFLGILAVIEEALRGLQPFGMSFVRSSFTEASTSVFQMVQHLNSLAGGRYESLFDRFRDIHGSLNTLLSSPRERTEGPLVLPMREVNIDAAEQVGGKIANLGEAAHRIGVRVPNGFVVSATAYRRFMEHNDLQAEIDRRIQAAEAEKLEELFSLSASIQRLISEAEVPRGVADAIDVQYRALEREEGAGIRLAMRSSALGEDVRGTSFAGQYRSELNVSGENILQAYREIVAGKYGLPAMTYRLNRGIRDEDVAMCVACLRMVDAVAGGVVYSRNPVNIRDNCVVVNSVWGLPKAVVDGSSSVDVFVVSREEPIRVVRREIPRKELKLACYPGEGIRRLALPEHEGVQPSLTDSQVLELARLAVEVEAYYRMPQDIEWALDERGAMILLQCRPLQQAPATGERGATEGAGPGTSTALLSGGVTASPGVGTGRVFRVKRDADALRFPDGAVLVTAQALPRWATLLGRASAVVSESGSLAGHLANVAREFGVPALFGASGAMKALADGQEVTVDADGLCVLEGRVDALLEGVQKPRNLMEGSPVFSLFEQAAGLVVPLNLLDPNAPAFRPTNCRTLHDITRFCHEKAVHEMFRFGKEHHFAERSSKQLFCEVPMQWWVLNLDDGYKEEVEGKFVNIDNIVSIPMLAIWTGITAIPWEGPPAMDGRGLMSVMFEATRNTSLAPGVRSKYTERNYFMISKHYCSLNSMLGFHFSLIEALVGDRSSENYVSFQFKGGAADFDRRLKRLLLTRDILEEYDFRVEVREDTLLARVEEREKAFMTLCLKVLGYLTIHTRQLDMVMSNPASVAHYRAKMDKDLRQIVGDPAEHDHAPPALSRNGS